MSNAQKFRTMDWLVGLATVVALGLSTWSLTTTYQHSERLVRLESETRDPPRWVEERFDTLGKSVSEIKTDIKEIKREVQGSGD